MNARRHLALGLFFLVVVGVLGYYTLFKTDVSFFGERTRITAYTENAGGLRKGAPVLYAGVRWGQVEAVMPDVDRPRDKRVLIEISLDNPIRLFEDHTAVIEASSVLGGVQLALDPGSPGRAEVDMTQPLSVGRTPDVLASLGSVVEENREALKRAISGVDNVVASLQTGNAVIARLINDEVLGQDLANAVKSISGTFDNTQALTDELRGGRGALGRLIYDPEVYDDIRAITDGVKGFVTDARSFISDARSGSGIIAMLLNDGEATTDVRSALSSVRSIVDKVDRGDGTLAKLLNDSAIADSLQSTAETITDFVKGIREGDGTIAKLFNDGRLYDNIRAFSDDLLDVSSAIRNQRGTIGRLIYDDAVIRQLEQVFATLQGSLEEAREAAPVSTFLSTLFLGF
ncbi:MAG: MlaD family protein [Planctomycetota bacterium]